MTGSSDGVIKLFRDYESLSKVHMVSSFRALVDLVPSTHNAGLVFDWLQGRGWALVAGDAKVIRVWNAATEMCTNVSSPRTSTNTALTRPGHPSTIRLMRNLPDLRPGRGQHIRRRVRRRRHPRLRPAPETHDLPRRAMEGTLAVGYGCPHAARRPTGAGERVP